MSLSLSFYTTHHQGHLCLCLSIFIFVSTEGALRLPTTYGGPTCRHLHCSQSNQEKKTASSNQINRHSNNQHRSWPGCNHLQDQLGTDQPPRPSGVYGTTASGGDQHPPDVGNLAQPNPGRLCPEQDNVARSKPDLSILLTTNSDDFQVQDPWHSFTVSLSCLVVGRCKNLPLQIYHSWKKKMSTKAKLSWNMYNWALPFTPKLLKYGELS